jgi:hypothetical protein
VSKDSRLPTWLDSSHQTASVNPANVTLCLGSTFMKIASSSQSLPYLN